LFNDVLQTPHFNNHEHPNYTSFVNLIREKDDTPTDYREFEVLTWSPRLKESQDETLGDGHATAGFQISHV